MHAVGTLPGSDPVGGRIAALRLPALEILPVPVALAGAVAVPLLTGRALQLWPRDVALPISATLFACGLVSIIRGHGVPQGRGVSLPVMPGVTLAVRPMALTNPGPDGARMVVVVAGMIHFGTPSDAAGFAPAKPPHSATPAFDPAMILAMLPVMFVAMIESRILPTVDFNGNRRKPWLIHPGTPLAALTAVGLSRFFNGAPLIRDENIAAAAPAAEVH